MKCINKNLPKVKELLEVVNDDEVALSSILEKYDTLPSVEEVSAKYSELSVRPVAFNKSLNTDLLNEVGRLVEVNDYGMIMTNGKDLKDDQLYAINQILIRKNSLYRQTYRLSQAKTGNYFITNGREGKISYNTTQSQRILPESAVQIMEVFKKRLGVDYQIINDTQAQNILKDKYNPAEGFYLHGGKVYVIEDNGTIDFDTTIHEFGHPFMRALRAYNPALFTNITNEISESKEGIDLEMVIKNDYKEWFEGENVKPEHVEDYLEELAVRGLTLYAKENFNPETGKPFQKAMDKLIRFLTTMLKDIFGRKDLKLAALSPNTNLKELADIFSLKQGDINLEELSVLRKPTNLNEIKYNLKALEILSSDKAKQVFAKGEKAGWDLNKTLTELQIPKEQKELILSLGKTKLDDIITDLLANYSYAIEINIAKDTIKYQAPIDSDDVYTEIVQPTQYYSNLTVPGGTNYTENEIAIPDVFISPLISSNDNIVWGHPTIGKSYLKEKGNNSFITLDDDYANEVNAFIDANKGNETRQEYKGRKPKEYNEFMLNLFDRLKVQAKKEGKKLFVSNTNILKERMSDFDKIINIPKDEFKKRFDARGATYGFEDWKSDIDNTIAKVDNSKVISTTSYLEDLLNGKKKSGITPSIKGHAQFATDNGIGWFRSDDLKGKQKSLDQSQQDIIDMLGGSFSEESTGTVDTKTRRILEVQSDLFQKGRDKEILAGEFPEQRLVKGFRQYEKQLALKENQFLQLLNKNNNWVTFFVKSIIQDSAKKGYEKVLFPSGNTASKVEGHTTLEQFKKQQQDRLEGLTDRKNNLKIIEREDKTYKWGLDSDGMVTRYLTKEDAQSEMDSQKQSLDKEIDNVKRELENVEREGFGALKPIYNFYENTVTNVLKKQGYNPIVVTDEYGNTWNEVVIKPKDLETIAFNKKPIQTEVYDNMLAVHNKILVKELTEEEEKLNKSPYVIVGDEDSEYDTPSRRSKRKFKSSWEGYNVDDLPRVSGNLFHSVSSQLIKFAFPEYNRHIPEEDLSEIPDNILNSINNIMEPIIQSSRQEGSVLVSELRVANTKTKIAGTIDVIKIKPTGNINVLDIKSQLNFGATQKTKYKKIESYSSQIADYVSMLRSDDAILDKVPYNVEKETVLNVKINVNNGVLLGFSSPQLTPVLHQETNNKKRNELIATLSSQIEMLLSKQTAFNKGDTEYARLESLIGKKRELVISLQTEADIKNILQSMMEELAIIEANIDAGVVNYIEYKGELELYSNIGKYITPENKEDRNKRDYIAGKAKGLYRDLYEKAKDQVLGQIAPNIINPNGPVKNADDLLSLQKDIDPTRANLFGAAYNNNPIVSAAYLEAQIVLAKAREQWVKKVQEISGITEELKEFLGENIYNPFIQESNGKATGRIISQYMPEFWAEFNKAKSNKNANWFKDNVTFDLEKYNFKLKSYNEALNSSFEKDVKIKKAVLATSEKYQDKTAEELQVLAEKFVRKDNKTKIENWRKTNKSEAKYFIPNDSWLDPKWKKIKQGEYKGTVVEKYYDMYTQTMDALDEFLPFDMGKNFIPDYSKSFIERVMTNGITNMNLGESYINSITIGFDEGAFGKINPFDNQPLKSIPVSGKRDFESKEEREKFIQKEKSYDLSSVLSTFLESAFRYKELQTIEQTLTVALDVLKEQNQIVETASGEAAKGTFNIFKQSKGLENTVANFEHFINSTLYGKSQDKEKGFKVKGNGITEALGLIKKGDEKLLSWARIFDRFLQYTGLNNLGYNLYSPIVNLIGGKSNALIIAMGGKYFNVPDFEFGFLSTAAGYFHVGNEAVEKANLLLREFSPDIDTYVKDMINTTSKYGINKAIDKFGPFSGMRYSEETVRNGIFIAMIKSNKNEIKWDDWKVENGKLVWIGEGNKPDIKTKELFRQKSFKVIGKAMGNMNPDDKIKLKKYWYGRAIMQHRGWLPAMWDARFSGILSGPQYDYILQEYVEGRFTTFYKTAVKKLISGEKMTDMEKQNFKEALVEHSLMIASYLLYLGLKAAGDDDDESKYWLKIADRVNGELVFFAPFEVSSKYKILISPAPSIGTMENLGKLIFDTPKELLGRTIDNEDWMKSAKPQKRLFRAIPVVGQAVRWMDDVFDTQIADTEDKK